MYHIKRTNLVETTDWRTLTLAGLKRGMLDHRFKYVTNKGKQAWLIYIQNEIYQPYTNFELASAQQFAPLIIKRLPSKTVNLIALACGSAFAEHQILHYLLNNGYQVNYYLVDYSEALLDEAIKNLRQLNLSADLTVHTIVADLFDQRFSDFLERCKTSNISNIFTMLGFTFGNFDDEAPLLIRFQEWLQEDDIILLDISIKPDQTGDTQTVIGLPPTQASNNHKTHFLFSLLNIDESYGQIEITGKYNPANTRYIKTWRFVFDATVEAVFGDETLCFSPKDSITLLKVNHYQQNYAIHLFNSYDFAVVEQAVKQKTKGCFLLSSQQ